ncbi:divergent polysaccharide deacetylase family protein [Pseudomaricurvus sp.]|uniref:divergent polysaccharide deacetylase family protein n=1 Tax=Pseudomaricurvus sp. TaxID=2004510 RepID=UPI003F6B873C
MKQLTTLLLYTALGLCLTLFGYSLWKATLGKSDSPHIDTHPAAQSAPADAQGSAIQPQKPRSTTPISSSETLPTTSSEATSPEHAIAPPQPQPATPETSDANTPIKIAIIIDDVGYSLPYGTEAASLPGSLTLAVLPHSPHGAKLAELGFQQGKEIMLHVPMSTVQHRKLDVGGLTAEMSQQEFETTLTGNLASIPHVRGLNNHMGSELTQRPQPMQWLMTALAQENLFFIDSRTSAQSVALQTAEANRVPTRKRDVFLDNTRTAEAIGQQFDTLIQLARERGSAIAIGHPYPETLAYLDRVLPELGRLGVQLVPVSRLLAGTVSQNPTTQAQTETPSSVRDL